MTERDKQDRPQDRPETPADADYEADAPADDAETEALRTENGELRDRLLRTMAEMENVRRRMERERQETAKYAVSNFARDMVSVVDNIRRAIEHVPADAAAKDPALKNFLDGIELTERELMNVLERHGVTRLDPMGEKFDPNMHQAMFEVEDNDKPAGTVTQVMQSGYSIGERCLRPALVGVSKHGAPQPEPAESGAAEHSPSAEATQPGAPRQPEPPQGPKSGHPRPGGRIDRSA